MNISIQKIIRSSLVGTTIMKNQLIYCIDTKECYYDVSDKSRIQLGCTIQLDSEVIRNEIINPFKNKIYIVLDSNKLYRYTTKWIEVTKADDILDIVASAQELIPTTITKSGVKYAPKTTAKNVYLNNGETVEDALKNMQKENSKEILFTRTEFVVASYDHQKIFNIPFPISNYDLERFPILAIAHGKLLKTDEYKLTTSQIILNEEELMKDEVLTLIFNYTVVIGEKDELDAVSVNNIRYFTGPNELAHKRENDVWFDTNNKVVKQYVNGNWRTIVDPGIKEGSVKEDNLSKDVLEKITESHDKINKIEDIVNNIVTKGIGKPIFKTYVLKMNTNIIEIPLEYDPVKDTLLVYRNSVLLDEKDYSISADNKSIIAPYHYTWFGSEHNITFNFILFKGL